MSCVFIVGELIALCMDSPLSLLSPRVQVPNNWVLGILVIVILVQVQGKYMITGYLDPRVLCVRSIADFTGP